MDAPHYHGFFNKGVDIVNVKQWIAKLPDAIKSGFTAAIAVFLGLFIPALTGWLNSLVNYVNSKGTVAAPSISTLGYAFASAVVAAGTGFAWAVFRWAQAKYPFIPGTPPTFSGGK